MEENCSNPCVVETPCVPLLSSKMTSTTKKHDSACADCGSARSSSIHENSSVSSLSFMSSSGCVTGDSGYLTETPNSANSSATTATTNTTARMSFVNAQTPVLNNSVRQKRLARSNTTTSTVGSRRPYYARVRNSAPIQSERATRVRSKFNSRLEASESQGDSCASSSPNQSLNSELKSLLRSQMLRNDDKQLMSSVPKTPASTASGLDILSPPLSPAVPSPSFAASEPVEQEDVEMKLVIVPQSTPQASEIVISVTSPTTSRSSPARSSIESQSKLSKMMLTDLSMSDIRPKRLDFSSKPNYLGFRRSRAVQDLAGRSAVDFMRIFGEESDHWRIVSKILSLLGAQDLCTVSMVSKVWRRICAKDSWANSRRLAYVILRKNIKENLRFVKAKAKVEAENVSAATSPKTRYAKRGFLLEVQNIIQGPANTLTPSSPPVSPSKVKFHSFVKAGRTLEASEYLLPCPRCSFACPVTGEKNIASCSRQGCSMEFCIYCSLRHTGPCQTALLRTPTKRSEPATAGSKRSKISLRRLLKM